MKKKHQPPLRAGATCQHVPCCGRTADLQSPQWWQTCHALLDGSTSCWLQPPLRARIRISPKSSRSPKCLRKSAPMMGTATSARRKSPVNLLPPAIMCILRTPQHAIGKRSAVHRRGVGLPVSTRNCCCDALFTSSASRPLRPEEMAATASRPPSFPTRCSSSCRDSEMRPLNTFDASSKGPCPWPCHWWPAGPAGPWGGSASLLPACAGTFSWLVWRPRHHRCHSPTGPHPRAQLPRA